MYIGSTSSVGLHHLVNEVVDNSVDEALAGHCDRVDVALHHDGSCSVLDNGRGIPTDIHPVEKISAAEVVMTKLHAGGKFENESYKYSGGLHGVGVSVVNALSEWLQMTIYRDGKQFEQSFKRGKPVGRLKEVGSTEKRGTLIRFKPDDKIFDTVELSFDTLASRLREKAFLNKGLTVKFKSEVTS
jgi:DNA gyrase subunit B